MGWGEPDSRETALAAETSRADAAEAKVAELQARLEAAGADLGRFTQSTLVKIKALEACAAALARMQARQAAATERLRQVGHTTPQGHLATTTLCVDLIDLLTASPHCYVTTAGTVLTEHDLDTLVAEAEQGYCTLATNTGVTCGHPLPCPHHTCRLCQHAMPCPHFPNEAPLP